MSIHITELHEVVALVLGLAGLATLLVGLLHPGWWSVGTVPSGRLALTTSAVLIRRDLEEAEIGGARFHVRMRRSAAPGQRSDSTRRTRRPT